jgi:hypothetical protein
MSKPLQTNEMALAPYVSTSHLSVRGQLVTKYLSQRLGIDLFVSRSEV